MNTNKEITKGTLWSLEMNASLNEHYYQTLKFLASTIDRAIRVVVALLALGSVLYAANQTASWWYSLAGLVAAIILNIVPVSNWAADCYALQKQWGDLRAEIQEFEAGVYGAVFDLTFLIRTKGQFDAPLNKAQEARFAEIVEKRNKFHTQDTLRWSWLAKRKWREELERRYDKGVVTPEQQKEYIDKMRPVYAGGGAAVA